MSATAGKVMPRPMGDYNAATEYTVLDIVIYNNRPYMAMQTTQGNLPTNTTYWLLLLDFPTEVDNVPTQNSENLVYSGGVYNATVDKMKADGSNASHIVLDANNSVAFMQAAIAKDAGASQDVSLTFTVAGTGNEQIILGRNIAGILKAHIGDKVFYTDNNVDIYIEISNVSINSSTVVAIGSLVEDVTDAISLTATININPFSNGIDGSVSVGEGSAVASTGLAFGKLAAANGTGAIALGDECVAQGDNSFAEGKRATAFLAAHAEGCDTFAMDMYSHAEGKSTWAYGMYSHTGGKDSKAEGSCSFAHGEGVTAYDDHEVALGKFNSRYSYTGKTNLLSVGNGADASNKANAFTVYLDGYVSIGAGHHRFKLTQDNDGNWGFYDDNNVFRYIGAIRLTQSVTLSTSADTTVTFTNASITATSWVEPYTSDYGITPTDVQVSNGSAVLTFAQADSAQTITVGIEIK